MKKIKSLIKWLLGLITIPFAALIILVMGLNPNDYKSEIQGIVEDQTGRTLLVNGDISWSFYPSIGLSVKDAELSNAKGFKAPYFAKVEHVQIGVQLLPLLKSKIQANQVVLKGATVNLEVKSNGQNNWSDLSGKNAKKESPQNETKGEGKTEMPEIRLKGLNIENATVNYTDMSAPTAFMLQDLNLNTNEIVLWNPLEFSGDFVIKNQYPKIESRFDFGGIVIADVPKNEFGVKDLFLNLSAKGKTLPNGAIKLKTETSVLVNTKKEEVDLKQLKIKLDESNFNGKAWVRGFDNPAVQFKVDVDQLNLDKYLPKSNESSETGETATSDEDVKIALPLPMLRKLNLNGELNIGKFQIMNIKTQQVKARLRAKRGGIDFSPLAFNLYDGTFVGGANLNVKGQQPVYKINAKLAKLNVLPFMTDFLDSKLIEGVGGFDVNVRTKGEWVSKIKRNLNGELNVELDKGVIHADMLNDLKVLLEETEQTELAKQIGDGKNNTPFNKLTVTGNIVNGLIKTQNLDISSRGTRILGDGSFDIPTTYLDAKLRLKTDKFECGVPMEGKVAQIDFGKFAKNALPNCLKDAVQNALNAEKEKLKQQAQARLDEEKAKLKAKAEAERKRLEEEARKRIEAEKQKAKDKIADELRKLF